MEDDQIASEQRIRPLSFGGGAFDTVMQLGVTQVQLVPLGNAHHAESGARMPLWLFL